MKVARTLLFHVKHCKAAWFKALREHSFMDLHCAAVCNFLFYLFYNFMRHLRVSFCCARVLRINVAVTADSLVVSVSTYSTTTLTAARVWFCLEVLCQSHSPLFTQCFPFISLLSYSNKTPLNYLNVAGSENFAELLLNRCRSLC